MDEALITAAKAYIEKLFGDIHDGHDVKHSLRVYRNAMDIAMDIAKDIPGCDPGIVALASLLHDADDHKLFDTADNMNARLFLSGHGISPDKADRICAVINSVSFSHNKDRRPDTIEGMIVQDADRLDAMGAVGIARTFAYGGSRGRSIEESVEHFHEKLLRLRDSMNTDAARAEAEKRHAFLLAFLEELKNETGIV